MPPAPTSSATQSRVSDAGQTDPAAQTAATSQFGFRVPDIITNLRVDQAWGYAGISTAIHEASGAYYGTPNVRQQRPSGRQVRLGVLGQRPVEPAGRRHHRCQLRLDQGCGRLCDELGRWQFYSNSNSRAMALGCRTASSAPAADVELTEAWSVNAGYQHVWGAAGTFGGKWRTSVYGGYVNGQLQRQCHPDLINQRRGCAALQPGWGGVTLAQFIPLAGNSCSPDFSFYQIGSRTQFNPHPLMDIGLDVFYTKLNYRLQRPGELGGERLAAGLHQLCVRAATSTTRALCRRSSAGSVTSIRDRLIFTRPCWPSACCSHAGGFLFPASGRAAPMRRPHVANAEPCQRRVRQRAADFASSAITPQAIRSPEFPEGSVS